ncbi:CRISPR system Cascade subunit CasC [Companilactobacillus paralimentarius]|uniref:type I-E CRISPR-associated protein Cas7/Cse4/CasC n=1 Tax=Companilactobacillus paralimentarius TaxID=83526 RepID=UPI00384B6A0C
MTNNLYLDINIIQTVPSSNLNRDDTGAPKTALYGGVTRARVSSQSWKHVVRHAFKEDHVTFSSRTKESVQLLANELRKQDGSLDEEAALTKANEAFKSAGIKVDKNNETGALLLISNGQIKKLAQYILNNDELDKKEIKKVLKGDQSLDLALFGRMVADNPELNVDAASQVAHAISTHEVIPEYDYFTALDDEQGEDTSGAAMLGTIEFNSATLYRYANVNVNELVHNLNKEDAIAGISAFIKDFALSMPTGKQNTFANKTLPNYVMVTIRQDTPVNLVSAFEKPVVSNDGYVEKSVERLENEYKQTLDFVDQPLLTVALSKYNTEAGKTATNLSDLLKQVMTELTKVVEDENTND